MSPTFSSSLGTNEIIAKSADLFDALSRKDIGDLLKELDYDWKRNTLRSNAQLVELLRARDLVEPNGPSLGLNRMGLLLLSRLLLHFDVSRHGHGVFGSLNDKYKDFIVISSGKNSVVAEARHKLLDSKVVLKLVRPGASLDITKSIGRLSQLGSNTAIVLPIDFLETEVRDLLGKPVTLACVVFPYIDGITFGEFLRQENHHLNSQVVMSFARQVGHALCELERIEAYHGDLHEGNILVDQYAKEGLRFKIVDISFDAMGSLPFEECRNNDLFNFKQHVWRIMSVQKSFMPRISLHKYIGTRNYLKIVDVLSESTKSFQDVIRALASDAKYDQYLREKAKFISEHFESPVSFRLQRYEEITDQTVAVRPFVPFDQLMQKITGFSNIYVSGNRGSGKSTYLAALAFFPNADETLVDVAGTFGIYFPCRQGEFRALYSRGEWDRETERRLITNIIVIKVIRRTLETLASGIESSKLVYPTSMRALRDLIAQFVPPPGIVLVERDIQSELENFVATMVRVEMEAITRLQAAAPSTSHSKDGRSLLKFFEVVRETFSELAATRFHLLFDDAGTPYVPQNVQRVMCDLTLTSNALFCVKLSAEKLTFEFESTDGKVLENGQDYFEHDISQILFIGSGTGGLNRSVLERYFRQIVEQRLKYFEYRSSNITGYLGDEEFSYDKLLKLLAVGRKDAYYCGWTAVWNIADRTPRNLLEIVSEIFSVGNIERSSDPRIVSMRDQDRAIRTISEKRLESLSQISGAVEVNGQLVSLGRHLYKTTAAIGSTFKRYLKSVTFKRRQERPRQHLAIERNDSVELSREAEIILRRLITFGVLDAGRAAYARDDEVKKPFYVLNRIYCPAFGIGYHRDDHLRLSRGKMDLLLIDPQRFMREGTSRLRNDGEHGSGDMFGYGD